MSNIRVSLIVTSVIIAVLGAGVLSLVLRRQHQGQQFEPGDCIQLARLTVVGCDDAAANHIVLGVVEDGPARATCDAWPEANVDLRMRAPGGRAVLVCMKTLPR